MGTMSFAQKCADLAYAEREYRIRPTDANKAAAVAAVDAIRAEFDATVLRAPAPSPRDEQFIRLCNAQLQSYAAWRDRQDPANEARMKAAIAALQAFMRPPRED